MIAYLLRRLLAMVPTLLGITFVTFCIMNFAPGDPVSTRFASGGEGGEGDAASQDRMADAIRAKKKLLGMMTEEHSFLAWDAGAPKPAREEGAVPEVATAWRMASLPGPEGWPKALALSPGGSTLWTGGAGRRVRSIDLRGRKVALELEGHEQVILALAVSEDGARIVSADGDGVVRSWSAADGKEAWTARVAALPVRDLAFLPDGRLLAAADDGSITILGADGARAGQLADHLGAVRALAVSPDGTTAWSGGEDRQLREWDVATASLRRVVAALGRINDLMLAPSGAEMYAACDDRKVMRVPLSGGEPAAIGEHLQPVTALALSADGGTLWSGGRDEIVRRWELPSGRLVAQSAESLGPVSALVTGTQEAQLFSASDAWRTVPVPQRYLSWLSRMARLDFDRSFKDDRPVIEKIASALRTTLLLNVLAILVIYAIAVPLGVLAAARRGSAFDHVSSVGLFVLYSIPSFWLATLLIMTFSSRTAWDILPAVGLHSPDHENLSYLAWLKDRLLHLVLPLAVMTYAGFASLSRYARTSMLETMGQDFIRTARAKGLAEGVVLWKHAFRNSLVTIVTIIGNLLPALIGGSVIVESIFSINGMGKLGFEAILARDYPVVMAITTFSALLTLLGILLSDILYTIVDPRITHR